MRRATLCGDGRPGPIEERVGRRLMRLVRAESDEGLRLLESGSVDLIGPDGDPLGRIPLEEAWRRLRERVERKLDEPHDDLSREALREGLQRLGGRSLRTGRS